MTEKKILNINNDISLEKLKLLKIKKEKLCDEIYLLEKNPQSKKEHLNAYYKELMQTTKEIDLEEKKITNLYNIDEYLMGSHFFINLNDKTITYFK